MDKRHLAGGVLVIGGSIVYVAFCVFTAWFLYRLAELALELHGASLWPDGPPWWAVHGGLILVAMVALGSVCSWYQVMRTMGMRSWFR